MRTMYNKGKLNPVNTNKTGRCQNKKGRRAFKNAQTFYSGYLKGLNFRPRGV